MENYIKAIRVNRKDLKAHDRNMNEIKSIRQEKLSQDARDILVFAFEAGVLANAVAMLRMTAVEVRIGGDDINRILNGGDGFKKHGGVESLHCFTHANDEDWAVVFAHDCDGDAERGRDYIAALQRA